MQHQTCKQCGRIQRFEFSVSDELWKQSGCSPDKALCIECWLEHLDRSGVTCVSAEDVLFLGIVGENVTGILHDSVKATT